MRFAIQPSWWATGLVALSILILATTIHVVRSPGHDDVVAPQRHAEAEFVGRPECIDCHIAAYKQWSGSDHDNAMDIATVETVLGDFADAEFTHGGITSHFYRKDDGFFVSTEGPGGAMEEFEIRYTFGIEPLQQYLVPFPAGRLQALPIAWDTDHERWFTLNPDTVIAPDDWLHWTRNGQNWNGMCAECHSTNLQKNYDPESDSYATTWSEIDVSCEACHGPGSEHVAWAQADPMAREPIDNFGLTVVSSGLDNRRYVEMCAPCHSRRSQVGEYSHDQTGFLQHFVPSLLEEGLYYPDGQIQDEVYVWGSFVQSKMYRNDVSCGDCHDPHSLALHLEGNELCGQCHLASSYDTSTHHFHKKIVDGKPSDGALCIKCHMPERPYMVIDYRADHSLRVPRPDLSEALGVPNACSQSGCHDDKELDWAVQAYTEWYGEARKPHYGTILAQARGGEAGAEAGLIALVDDPLNATIVRATALEALGAYPTDRAAAIIRRALVDDEATLRRVAIDALFVDNPETLASLLAPRLFDSVSTVRERAASRLAGIPRDLLNAQQRVALDKELETYIANMRAMLDFASAGLNLGNLYEARGELQIAEQYYRTALRVDDLFYPAKMNLAVLLSRQGDDDAAEQLLREVLQAYPEQYGAAYSLSLLLVASGRIDEALAYMDQAAEGLPRRSRIHYNRGLLLARLGRDEAAETALRRALQLEPQSIDYLYALIDFCARRDRLGEALELTHEMIALHPNSPLGYQLQAVIEERLAMMRE